MNDKYLDKIKAENLPDVVGVLVKSLYNDYTHDHYDHYNQ